MQEILNGVQRSGGERGWKLFMLLPRMLLFRSARGGVVPARSWKGASDNFEKGLDFSLE